MRPSRGDEIRFRKSRWWASLGRRRVGRRVLYVHQFDVEDQVRLGRNLSTAFLAIGELIRDQESPLAAHAHALKAGVPSGDHFAFALLEVQRLGLIARGVELGSVVEPSGVMDEVDFSRLRQFTG